MTECEICEIKDWSTIYNGPIRDGAFGSSKKGKVKQCNGCGIYRLNEEIVILQQDYESSSYRELMGQGLTPKDFLQYADPFQIYNLATFWPISFRNKFVADIGCAAGSFIGHIAGLAQKIVAVEPTKMYHESLNLQGFQVFSYTAEAILEYKEKVDIAVSFQAIEHVPNPVTFLSEIFALLKPGGKLILSTPNRNDILMKLLPEEFPAFFYRRQHRWYFDEPSLKKCVNLSGFKNLEVKYVHTLGMSNTISWLKERIPTGDRRIDCIDSDADNLWSSYLKTTKQTDTLYLLAEKSGGNN